VTLMSEDARSALLEVESVLGADLYAVAPKADYLLGEVVLLGAASELLVWFLQGFVAGTKESVVSWGKSAQGRLARALRALIIKGEDAGSEPADAASAKVADAAAEARSTINQLSTDERLASVGHELSQALISAGVPRGAAVRYAEAVRAASATLLTGV
jgi:hypothetical protein